MNGELRKRLQAVPRLALDLREAAAALGVSDRTLWSLTAPRGPVRAVRVGKRSVRYCVRDLERYLSELPPDADEAEPGDTAAGARP